MQWSPQQDAALTAVSDWLERKDKPLFRLFGYAGTGKTTLAKHFAEGVDGLVLFAAYTGKAAYVLQSKGCPEASTIHKLIYTPADKSRKRLRELQQALAIEQDEQERERLEKEIKQEQENVQRPAFSLNLDSPLRDASLLVVDECSMAGTRVAEDLLSFGVPILALGDPAQLPPVGDGGYFTDADPDFMLTEIHRQARDNPIIRMATMVRRGEPLPKGQYGESKVVPWDRSGIDPDEVMAANQILVGRNATRHASNARCRRLLERGGPMPEAGDRLVCLRNNHDQGLLNGGLWTVLDSMELPDEDQVGLTLKAMGEETTTNVQAHAAIFRGEDVPWWAKQDAEEFDYGYALTTHKAQGSQWDNVYVFDESYVFRTHQRNWLYTAITRAAERVTVVRR